MKKIIFLTLLSAAVLSCTCGRKVDWSSGDSWFSAENSPATCVIDSSFTDVFYIVSTCVSSSFIEDGTKEVYNAVLDSAEKAELTREIAYVRKNIFPDSLNFFSPYYHQATMNGLLGPLPRAAVCYVRALLEVKKSFDYYMDNLNNGRPFIIVGFSQGAMMVRDLLRLMSDSQYSRMVAAYVIGYGLNSFDLSSDHIVPAAGQYDRGVSITFNSVVDSAGICSLLHNKAAVCINPVNWRTDSTPATFEYEGGTYEVSLDTLNNVLLVPGARDFEIAECWPKGCLHHYDLLFYTSSLKRNALDRAYRK